MQHEVPPIAAHDPDSRERGHGGLRFDLFCRVIDNHGDLGVCWRLAADLAGRGDTVRLFVDDGSALAWMAPQGARGVDVFGWSAACDPAMTAGPVGDVVIEAFGCELPPPWIAAMAARTPPPAWINLEYLSAEPYVERSHGLRSPRQHDPGRGLEKRFFFPGFTPRTGGLLREPGLLAARAAFEGPVWLADQGLAARDGERVVSLFCYEQPALHDWLRSLADRPTLLLATHGSAERQTRALLEAGTPLAPALRIVPMQALPQDGYDRLLWSSSFNIVRGEDSFVRAQWAGAPFVWHIYPQHDGAHLVKLEAFLDLFLHGADASLARSIRTLWRDWNAHRAPSIGWPDPAAWRRHCERWRDSLCEQSDLVTQLHGFVARKPLK